MISYIRQSYVTPGADLDIAAPCGMKLQQSVRVMISSSDSHLRQSRPSVLTDVSLWDQNAAQIEYAVFNVAIRTCLYCREFLLDAKRAFDSVADYASGGTAPMNAILDALPERDNRILSKTPPPALHRVLNRAALSAALKHVSAEAPADSSSPFRQGQEKDTRVTLQMLISSVGVVIGEGLDATASTNPNELAHDVHGQKELNS